jgi:hypothetical protein
VISGLLGLINEDSTIQTLLGGANKVGPVRAVQDLKRPYVVVRRVSAPTIEYKGGPSNDDKPHFNVVVYAENYKKAEEISNQIRNILDGHKDENYKSIWYVDAEDLFDSEDGNNGSVVIVNKYLAWSINTIS